MIISQIVAASTNNAIGKNNQLLWHMPRDLKFFKDTTWGLPVIMGRKTFESVNKPMPGRINIVITKQTDWKRDGVFVVSNLEEALIKAKETNCKEIFIIGGGQIYKQSMDLCGRIYLTRINGVFEDADTFFPVIDASKWELVSKRDFEKDEKHAFDYSFQVWEKKKL